MAQALSPKSPGSIPSAIFWMTIISLLLFWLPVLGPAIAGFVGGKKAGGVGPAILAALLPGILFGVLLFLVASSLTGIPLYGAFVGAVGTGIAFAHIGPLLLGAIVGGALA